MRISRVLLWRSDVTDVMDCAECNHLTAERENLKKIYERAVDLLFATGYQATNADYGKMRNSVDEARSQFELAAYKLAKHKLTVHPAAS